MRRLLAVAVAVIAAAPLLAQPKDFFFQPNDRVVFLGDSITEQYQYSSYMELYLTTRFPKGNFLFLNAGIGGDTANGGASRFQSHVLDDKPTAVTINFGMNDGGYNKFDENRNKVYREKTEAMLKMAKEAKVRVALCSPNAIDPRLKKPAEYFETQKEFYAPLKDIAAKFDFPFADQYAVTRAEIEAMMKDEPKADKVKPYYDGFHTSPPGGLIMAHAILTQLKAPALVSDVAVAGGKAEAKAAKVTDLKASDTEVTFTREDEALPMPVLKDWRPMLPYIHELKDLNYYGLTVKGLKEGKYDVSVDGVKVGTYTAKELGEGVNVGNAEAGPLFDQGKKVLDAVNKKNSSLVKPRFDKILRNNRDRSKLTKEQQADLDKQLAAIEEEQKNVYKLVELKPHKWAVTVAK